MVFCFVLFHGFVSDEELLIVPIPEVFAEQVDDRGSRPHDFIDDDVGRQSASLKHRNISFCFVVFIIPREGVVVNPFL